MGWCSTHKSRGCGCGVIGGLLFIGVWTTGVLAFDAMIAYGVARQLQASSYPTTGGVIVSSGVKEERDSDGTSYRVDVRYKYWIDGREYRCTQYRYGDMGSSDRGAFRVVEQLPPGAEVDVHYNPADPADAVLRAGIEGKDLFLAMFLTPFNVVMLGGWYVIARTAYQRFMKPPAGGAKIVRRDWRQMVQVAGFPAIGTFALALLGTSFASIFIVGFGFGFNASLPVMLGAWAVILGISFYFYLRRLARDPGKWVVIDEMNRTLILPPNDRQDEETTLPFDRVRDFFVKFSEKRDSDGDLQRSEAPVIRFTDDDGEERTRHLAGGNELYDAEGLVRWLREQVGLPEAPADHHTAP